MVFNTKIISLMVFFVLFSLALQPPAVSSHHGWGWATESEFEITGEIINIRLGNPHGEVTIVVGTEKWIIEIGQPWRNQRAGLTKELLQAGQIITVHGHRASNPEQRLVKAERVIIQGRSYNLYPDRNS